MEEVVANFSVVSQNLIGVEQTPMAGLCEHGNKPSGSIKKTGFF